MKIETVKSMTEQYLKDNGYDGLTCEDCCCFVGNLFSCDDGYDGVLSCLAGVDDPTLIGMITLKQIRDEVNEKNNNQNKEKDDE